MTCLSRTVHAAFVGSPPSGRAAAARRVQKGLLGWQAAWDQWIVCDVGGSRCFISGAGSSPKLSNRMLVSMITTPSPPEVISSIANVERQMA